MPSSTPRPGRVVAPRDLVRCLGPGPEHLFKSRDRVRERICPRCRRVLEAKNYGDSIRHSEVSFA